MQLSLPVLAAPSPARLSHRRRPTRRQKPSRIHTLTQTFKDALRQQQIPSTHTNYTPVELQNGVITVCHTVHVLGDSVFLCGLVRGSWVLMY